MPSSLQTEVLIVGAGPAGLACAIGLAMRGVDFMIVDALPDAQNTSRAAVQQAGIGFPGVTYGSFMLADRFRDGPVVLVGDAAHVHSPAGGQGMNLGLRDARSLSESLVGALRKDEQHRLDAYAVERRRSAKEVLRMTARLTGIATMPNARMRAVRNRLIAMAARLPAFRRRVALALAGFER